MDRIVISLRYKEERIGYHNVTSYKYNLINNYGYATLGRFYHTRSLLREIHGDHGSRIKQEVLLNPQRIDAARISRFSKVVGI